MEELGHLSAAVPSPPARRYKKGERRYKHVSRTSQPEFRSHRGNPKKFVGKCPNNIPHEACEDVLQRALPAHAPDAQGNYPRRLYAFYREIVFEFRLSDHQRDYHAFPLRGPMPKSIVRELRASLRTDVERDAYDTWIETYVQQGS